MGYEGQREAKNIYIYIYFQLEYIYIVYTINICIRIVFMKATLKAFFVIKQYQIKSKKRRAYFH